MKRNAGIANPSSPDGRELVVSITSKEAVTDRAHRYRANAVLDQLPQEHRDRCHFCGASDRPLMAGHVDGHEENNDPANISPTCRPCNNAIAANFARLDVGRRTRQYNGQPSPAASRASYREAVEYLRTGSLPAKVLQFVKLIQNTPHADRNRFAR